MTSLKCQMLMTSPKFGPLMTSPKCGQLVTSLKCGPLVTSPKCGLLLLPCNVMHSIFSVFCYRQISISFSCGRFGIPTVTRHEINDSDIHFYSLFLNTKIKSFSLINVRRCKLVCGRQPLMMHCRGVRYKPAISITYLNLQNE